MIITKENIEQFLSPTKLVLGVTADVTEIQYIPEDIIIIRADGTRLEKLPRLPETLSFLYCAGTNLKSLPELPDSLTTISTLRTKLPEELQVEFINDKEEAKKFRNKIKVRDYIGKL